MDEIELGLVFIFKLHFDMQRSNFKQIILILDICSINNCAAFSSIKFKLKVVHSNNKKEYLTLSQLGPPTLQAKNKFGTEGTV